MSPRRTSGPTLTVIRWQAIPAQVTARDGERTAKATLPPRFQKAIDRAAMGAGAAGSEEYMRHWRRESRPCEPDLDAAVDAEVAALDESHPPPELERLVREARADRQKDAP